MRRCWCRCSLHPQSRPATFCAQLSKQKRPSMEWRAAAHKYIHRDYGARFARVYNKSTQYCPFIIRCRPSSRQCVFSKNQKKKKKIVHINMIDFIPLSLHGKKNTVWLYYNSVYTHLYLAASARSKTQCDLKSIRLSFVLYSINNQENGRFGF